MVCTTVLTVYWLASFLHSKKASCSFAAKSELYDVARGLLSGQSAGISPV